MSKVRAVLGMLVLLAVSAVAQVYAPASFSGWSDVQAFGQWTMHSVGNTPSGSATMQLDSCYFAVQGGSSVLQAWFPLAVGVSVKVLDDTNGGQSETVAITAVATPSPSVGAAQPGYTCAFTGTFTYAHSQGVRIVSADGGLGEAIATLSGAGGTVAITPGSNVTNAMLAAAPIFPNVSIYDLRGPTIGYWTVQPSTLTAISAPTTSANLTCATTAGLVCQSATTGGTWPNSAEIVGEVYVDALGGWSASSTTATLTPSASGTNVLQFNSPAASTGAAGWLPFGGATYNSATYMLPVTATTCTLSTTFTAYPVCAIGSNATILAPVTTTSLNPQSGGVAGAYNPNPQSHTTFAYRPSRQPAQGIQLTYGPFTACGALTAGQKCEVGTVQLPTAFLQTVGIGGTVRFSFDVSNTLTTAGTATGVDVEIGDITDFSSGTPKVVCTLLDPTSTGTANAKYHEECDWTVNAIGTTGTIMPGGFGVESIAGSGGAVVSAIAEQGTAAITADILDQDSVHFVYLQTSGASTTTPPQMLDLKIEVLN